MLAAAQSTASTSAPVRPDAASACSAARTAISAISDSWSSARGSKCGRMRVGSSTPAFSIT